MRISYHYFKDIKDISDDINDYFNDYYNYSNKIGNNNIILAFLNY